MDRASCGFIFTSFASATTEDWRTSALLVLAGPDPLLKPAFEKGNLSQLPYYDQLDEATQANFQLSPASNEFLGPRAWFNMASLDVKKEVDANKHALSQLNSGADGILFNLKTNTADVSALLEQIEWPYCAISFAGDLPKQF